MKNSLLTSFTLPPFSIIQPEQVIPAIKQMIETCRSVVEKVIVQESPYTWDTICQPIVEINDRLERIFSPINHLNSVKNSSNFRQVYEQALLLISEYNTWIGQNKELYQAYLKLKKSKYYTKLNLSQKKAISNAIRDFKLSGVDLPKEKQQRYSKVISRLAELASIYSNNVLDSTMGWSKLISNKNKLKGMPESIIDAAKAQAKARKQKGWILTLDIPIYLPVMKYCDNRELREELYRAYSTRASEIGPNAGKWDNGPIMMEQLILRHELAQLLGFESYIHKSLSTKMAKKPKKVLNFLTDLVNKVRPKAEKELKILQSFVEREYGINKLQPWDLIYYSEKQKQYLYNVSDEQLRPYFPEEIVINGLFQIINRLYGINTKERKDIDVWHPDVRFFDLYNEKGYLQGSFYLDLYSREYKRSGAWMDNCINMLRKADGSVQKPVAYLTCNFNYPINGKPALFNHEEVVTLFHEFGHVLHHVLTCIDVSSVSGINGVPWDAIELPSQFMENWCWEPEALEYISSHYETGEPLPKKLLNKIIERKNYQSALFIIRQIEFSLFDFHLHSKLDFTKNIQILEILNKVKRKVAVISSPSWERFPNTFSHIFGGSYAAGYYSYLWADVLAADAFSRFKEEGIFNRNTGQSFLENILSRGGSEDPITLFKRFLGREPQVNTMLKYRGIDK